MSFQAKWRGEGALRLQVPITVDAFNLLRAGFTPDQVKAMDFIQRVHALPRGSSRLIAFCKDGRLAAPPSYEWEGFALRPYGNKRLMWRPGAIMPIEEVESMDDVGGVIIAYAKRVYVTGGDQEAKLKKMPRKSHPAMEALWRIYAAKHAEVLDSVPCHDIPQLKAFWEVYRDLCPFPHKRSKLARLFENPLPLPASAFGNYEGGGTPIGVVNTVVEMAMQILAKIIPDFNKMTQEEKERNAQLILCGIPLEAVEAFSSF